MSGVPTGWRSDRLKNVAAINAVALSAGTDPDYEFEYLEISNVDYHGIVDPNAIERLRFEGAPSRARRRVAAGCTVISSVRPNLQAVAFFPDAPEHFVCSTGFNVVAPQPSRLLPQFAYYHLISEKARQYFEAAATGVGYPAVGDKEFNAITVPLPSLPEQQRIVAYLDASCAAIDAAVAAKRRQLKTLDALRTALVYEAVTQGINRSAATVVHDIPSYGDTPKHWKRSKLRYEISIQNGDFASDKLQDNGAHPIFGGNGVMGHTNLSNVDGETVVIGRVGAYCGNAHYMRGKSWVSDNALIVKSRHHARFLCYLFNALNFNAEANNTAQPVITGTKIKNTYVVLPPPAEQEAICAFLDEKLGEMKRIVAGIDSQIAVLTAYRKSLIHECVTGQRRVTDENVRRAGHSERSQPAERRA
jgi:type I restriction enzyme S subunit